MVRASTLVVSLLASVASVTAFPLLEKRQSITTLTTAQVNSYNPFAYYVSAAYCEPAKVKTWTCGTNCDKNPGFKVIANGGDGGQTQYWFVGYDPTLKSIIVGHQGTDGDKILSVLNNAAFGLKTLKTSIFPGIGTSAKAHSGFVDAHERSAAPILAAVRQGLSTYGSNTQVTVTGWSLGGALAILTSTQIATNIPTARVKTVSYGSPRVGNEAFANFANARAEMVRINNKKDIVPILPGRFLSYAHTEGEIHVTTSGSWVSCPGQDNTASQCTIGTVPNILAGDVNDHDGPYNGITLGCDAGKK
ncbi:hypothetical protein CVT24_011178 [Panaeolus cyanescens]|uniref:Fungal lipase-type domain-containing protein n=1 Tax=Panaeolus cyanescens TaxID=181874 RepID=A0A409WX35_9AGAR|nr:hypothetical protein CVT24_011178 [Panaeolus cyanescens]